MAWMSQCKVVHLLGCNAHFVCFDLKLKSFFLICIFFPMGTNEMCIVYNDFVGAKYGFHDFKCDLILNFLLMCF
jgi:hypothetical protein